MNIEIIDLSVNVPGGSVFVRRWNSTHNAHSPIILLHDSLGCVALWRDFPATLAHHLRRPVIAYDRLGFGQSSARNELPSINFISEEAEVYFPSLRSGLGLTDFALFGHSVGGAMALLIAASSGNHCEAVITEAAQPYVEQLTLSSIRAGKEQFSQPEQFNRLTKYHGDKSQWVLDAWTEVWLSPEFWSWNLDPYLGLVSCPVLAIHGDLDEYGSVAFPHRITSSVNGPSELAILNQCGHVPHRERKEEVLRLTASFLERRAK
ncbi:MAG: alpha/beta hydrolase [Acidobacteria bacterium]|nr:alpha/beta hydrolase [Acidobacteriota bacterium]MBI3424448.1 alpha/beta hydrolase [Acidobacteriota bacterium]